MELFFRAKQSPFEYPFPLYKVKGLGYPGQTDPSTPTFPLLLSAPVTQGLPCHTSPTLDGHRQWFPHLAWRTPLRGCYLTFRRNLGNFKKGEWLWLLKLFLSHTLNVASGVPPQLTHGLGSDPCPSCFSRKYCRPSPPGVLSQPLIIFTMWHSLFKIIFTCNDSFLF